MEIKGEIREKIENAITELVARGLANPTNEQVRQHLGGGSLSYISPVVREWKERRREARALPDEVRGVLEEAGASIWRVVNTLAENDAKAIYAEAQVERDAALGELAYEEKRAKALATRLEQVTEKFDQQKEAIAEYEYQQHHHREKVERLESVIEVWQGRYEDMKAERDKLSLKIADFEKLMMEFERRIGADEVRLFEQRKFFDEGIANRDKQIEELKERVSELRQEYRETHKLLMSATRRTLTKDND